MSERRSITVQKHVVENRVLTETSRLHEYVSCEFKRLQLVTSYTGLSRGALTAHCIDVSSFVPLHNIPLIV